MKWLEIVKLRSVRENAGELDAFFRSIDQVNEKGLVQIKIYRHAAIETDWSLHLLWAAEKQGKNGSALGFHLARVLKDFGLVDHSLWIEEEKKRKGRKK